MERERVTPKSYPINLIDKDWSKRELYFKKDSTDFLDKVHDLNVRDDDVWIVTYPKCGTTWMQELLWLLMNDCDFETALATDQEIRSPFMEFSFYTYGDADGAIRILEDLDSPRLIKTHLPLALLPAQLWQKKAKVVYVSRNPLDAMVSSYYHGLSWGFYYGQTMEQFFENEILRKKIVEENPIAHFAEFYHLRHEPWIFYTSFENMKDNLCSVIENVAEFLNKPITHEQMERLLKHLSFEEMKNNPTTNHLWERKIVNHPNAGKEDHKFVRRGKVNGYKDELQPDMVAKINCFINAELLRHDVTLDNILLLKD
ncbi:luciferin sulfotransferase [Drosophila tropicalis]|uniref:luciferin sulfotransferase n=1 Tax=Drosophila tropicalis TaxID=46794 RepID=UPI0035ABA46D